MIHGNSRHLTLFRKKKLDIIYPRNSGKQSRLNIMPLNSDFRILAKNSKKMREGGRVRRNLHHTLHDSHFIHKHFHNAIRGVPPEATQSSQFLRFAAKFNYVLPNYIFSRPTLLCGNRENKKPWGFD